MQTWKMDTTPKNKTRAANCVAYNLCHTLSRSSCIIYKKLISGLYITQEELFTHITLVRDWSRKKGAEISPQAHDVMWILVLEYLQYCNSKSVHTYISHIRLWSKRERVHLRHLTQLTLWDKDEASQGAFTPNKIIFLLTTTALKKTAHLDVWATLEIVFRPFSCKIHTQSMSCCDGLA